jgi:hypothetical protein
MLKRDKPNYLPDKTLIRYRYKNGWEYAELLNNSDGTTGIKVIGPERPKDNRSVAQGVWKQKTFYFRRFVNPK